MKHFIGAPLIILALENLATTALSESPIVKTVTLVDHLASKVKADGERRQTEFRNFLAWCNGVTVNLQQEIKTRAVKLKKLGAIAIRAKAIIDAASGKIASLSEGIAKIETESRSALAIREKEAQEFAKGEAELVEVIDSLSRAIDILERQMSKSPTTFAQVSGTSLDSVLQSLKAVVEAASFSSIDKQKLFALLQSRRASMEDDSQELSVPSAYKRKSTNIVDILEDLKEKAEEELSSSRKAEVAAKHNFEMLKQSMKEQREANSNELATQKKGREQAYAVKAQVQSDIAPTLQEIGSSKRELKTQNQVCIQTAINHDATNKAREEELRMFNEVRTMLRSNALMPSLIQVKALQHFNLLNNKADLTHSRVVVFIEGLAKEQHSAALAQLASQIDSIVRLGVKSDDPFAKVKALITALINRLESEKLSNDSEKDYCSEQTSKAKSKKLDLREGLARDTAKIDQYAARSAELKNDIKQLQGELADLAKKMSDLQKCRQEQNADYQSIQSNLQSGIDGLRQIVSLLRDYYGNPAAAAAMVQGGDGLEHLMQQTTPPEAGAKSSSAGERIIATLETLINDFAKSLTMEDSQEADSVSEYREMLADFAASKAAKEQDIKHMTKEYVHLETAIAELTSDKNTAGTELGAVIDYTSKLQNRCVAKVSGFEERQKRYQAEIAGLKEALNILEEEVSFVQNKGQTRRESIFLAKKRS